VPEALDPMGVGSGEGVSPSPVGVRSGASEKNVSILSFEMLNFYAFWTLEQGDSTVFSEA